MELRTENLVVGYDKHPLIKNVNLRVKSGEVLTLIGPNGAGKSTILKTITKQLKILGGAVYIGDTSMSNMRDSEIARTLSMVNDGTTADRAAQRQGCGGIRTLSVYRKIWYFIRG